MKSFTTKTLTLFVYFACTHSGSTNDFIQVPKGALIHKRETVQLEAERYMEVAVYETMIDGPPVFEEIVYSWDNAGQLEIIESIKAVSNRAIATFSIDKEEEEIGEILNGLDLIIERNLISPNTYLVNRRKGGTYTLDVILSRLDSLPKEILLEFYPDYVGTWEVIPNDPFFGDLWHLYNVGQPISWPFLPPKAGADIKARAAWDIIHDAPNSIVAILDSGTAYTHSDLAGNIWVNSDEIPNNKTDDDSNGYVDDVHGYDFTNNDSEPLGSYFHGTFVAGLAGAVGNNFLGVTGTAWEVPLMIGQVGGPAGPVTSAVAEGIRYAVDNGACVINLSLAVPNTPVIRSAVEYAQSHGVLLVVAAGNQGMDIDWMLGYPSCYAYNNIITVTATDAYDGFDFSSYNYGRVHVDLAAPGRNVYSTTAYDPWGNEYNSASGTSFASPIVAGAVALLIERFPNDTYITIRDRLLNSTDKLSTLTHRTVTGGKLNLQCSLSVFSHSSRGPHSFVHDSPWFGLVDDSEYPAIWHEHLERLILNVNDVDESSIYMYAYLLGAWVWTGKGTYPWFWRIESDDPQGGDWIYYYATQTTFPNGIRHFWNQDEQRYEYY